MSKLATVRDGTPDGALIVISRDHSRWLPGPTATLQQAFDFGGQWERVAAIAADLEAGGGEPLTLDRLGAPLPRAYQYCEGSTYLSHMERCRAARGMPLPPGHGDDLAILQGASDRFRGPTDPILLGDEDWGLDFEATVAVVVDHVPQGIDPVSATAAVRLVVLANDLTLRNILVAESARGIGFFQAKPLRHFAPVAVTPSGLGSTWDGRLLHATVRCWVNGELIGELDSAADTSFDFGKIIAAASRTRPLAAGTVVGSGTISNRDPHRGFGCLAEKRAVQQLDGKDPVPYLRAGDLVEIEAFDGMDQSLFGRMGARVENIDGGAS